ncbi:MAG: VWA domain-containing protein, partial [Chloroflexota bacterium]|nr:VWA domain-containing protein [Chloroflexota bacterium]
MTFLAPLAALFALSLPLIVLLHLRRSRPRPLPVTTLRFWEQAARHQRQRLAPRRPPRSLLLLAQLLIAALLTLALVRPATPLPRLPGGATPRQLIVVLDRSAAMRATDVAPTRFAAAKDRARGLIAGAGADEGVTLVTLGAEPLTLRSRDAGDRAELLAALDALGPGGGRADLNGALPLLRAALSPDRENRIVLLSGGPFAAVPDRDALAALPAAFAWEWIGGVADNLAITRLVARPSPRAPDRVDLFARVANYSAAPVNGASRLEADGVEVDVRPLAIAASGMTELVWQLPRGVRGARLRIDGGGLRAATDAAPHDNEAWVVLREAGEVRV